MPVTILDAKTALIVVDLQKAIMAFAPPEVTGPVFAAAGKLAAAFRRHGLPVVLVNVAGGAPGRTEQQRPPFSPPADGMQFVPELGQQPGDLVVTKKTWGVFASTNLEEQLRSRGVTQVVVCGIATTAGVESSARQAFEAGFNVTLATDAMADRSPEAHEASVTRIFPRIGETGTSDEIIALLDSTHAGAAK